MVVVYFNTKHHVIQNNLELHFCFMHQAGEIFARLKLHSYSEYQRLRSFMRIVLANMNNNTFSGYRIIVINKFSVT